MGKTRHRAERVVFYVTTTELAAIEEQARADGRPVSEWIRERLLGSAVEEDGRRVRWHREAEPDPSRES